MELLVDKVVNGKDPEQVMDISPLVPVTKENVDSYAENWKRWLRQ
jgi:ribose transport system substrate-binding protein